MPACRCNTRIGVAGSTGREQEEIGDSSPVSRSPVSRSETLPPADSRYFVICRGCLRGRCYPEGLFRFSVGEPKDQLHRFFLEELVFQKNRVSSEE